MPCSISPCAISARSMAESNQIGRTTRPLFAWSSAMSARRSRSGTRISAAGADGHSGEGADLDHLAVDFERPRRQPQALFRPLLGAVAAVVRQDPGDCKLVAAQCGRPPRPHRLLQNRHRRRREQSIAGVVAMAVVDGRKRCSCNETIRRDCPALAAFARSSSVPSAKPLRLSRPVTGVGRRGDRGPSLASIRRSSHAASRRSGAIRTGSARRSMSAQSRDLRARAQNDLGAIRAARKKAVPLPISRTTAAMTVPSTTQSWRALSSGARGFQVEKTREHMRTYSHKINNLRFGDGAVGPSAHRARASSSTCPGTSGWRGWCGRWESNPHSRYGKRILSPQRLPFRHVRSLRSRGRR